MTDQFRLPTDVETFVRQRFAGANLAIKSADVRNYPDETIVVVRVTPDDFSAAAAFANQLDRELNEFGFKGFVTVRPLEERELTSTARLEHGIADPRATELVNLITARSRTSEIQPSLSYIQDAARNIVAVMTPRHHLIFGRRGAGKTALMVEARRRINEEGHLSAWVNVQTLRDQPPYVALLWVLKHVCEVLLASQKDTAHAPAVQATISLLRNEIDDAILDRSTSSDAAQRFVPRTQAAVSRFMASVGRRLYLFLDDLQYFPRQSQPELLDLVHSAFRESDVWLKVATIKHLSRWFQATPPMGLQRGHDADHIDLDVTLEDPSQAKVFLEAVLRSYAKHVGISSLGQVFSSESLDRLVLASGAVPRDYLVLSANAVRQGQQREKSRTVGVQDVNKAAGDAAKLKIRELEDDVASDAGAGQSILEGLQTVRAFCLDDRRCTYFRVDFADKEQRPGEYGVMQSLMDLRLLHLVNSGLSDEREAGHRSEVFMLDLSQFSGERLKKHLRVLDFAGGHLVVKETGTPGKIKVGATPKQRLGLLRRGPRFDLALLTPVFA